MCQRSQVPPLRQGPSWCLTTSPDSASNRCLILEDLISSSVYSLSSKLRLLSCRSAVPARSDQDDNTNPATVCSLQGDMKASRFYTLYTVLQCVTVSRLHLQGGVRFASSIPLLIHGRTSCCRFSKLRVSHTLIQLCVRALRCRRLSRSVAVVERTATRSKGHPRHVLVACDEPCGAHAAPKAALPAQPTPRSPPANGTQRCAGDGPRPRPARGDCKAAGSGS